MNIRETKAVKEALALADLVRNSMNPIGEITGPAGTGKSMAGRAIVQKLGALRVSAWEGMTRHQLLRRVAEGVGIEGAHAADKLLAREYVPPTFASAAQGASVTHCPPEGGERPPLGGHATGAADDSRVLIVFDEANKMTWRLLETVRYLADECGIAAILVGTEFYTRKFSDARTRPLLEQLGSRIGAKRMATRHLDRAETYAHVIRPAFGDLTDKELVTAFWQGCRRGNYREAVELAQECVRLMAANGLQSLTAATVELACKWMANRHV